MKGLDLDAIIGAQTRFIALKESVDLRPYTPNDDAPDWLKSLGLIARSDEGVIALLGPSGVKASTSAGGRERILPDPTAVFLAGLADSTRKSRRRFAVGLPPVARHLPLLLASSALLAETLDHAFGVGRKTGGGVLVISHDLDVRSRYFDLYVGSDPLNAAHPGSRMRPTGERVSLSDQGNQLPGVCFFLPPLQLPPKIAYQPALTILDLRYGRWTKRAENLAGWVVGACGTSGSLALYSLGDGDTLGALTKAGFEDVPIDHAAIATSSKQVVSPVAHSDGSTVDLSTADAADFLDRDHCIVEISQADDIASLIASIGRFIDEQPEQESLALHRARWLHASLGHMPVPLVWYEQAARLAGRSTLRRTIDRLGSESRFEATLGPVIQTLRMRFDQLYKLLERENPRAASLKKMLPRLATSGAESILVLVRDRVTESAVKTWLSLEAFPNAEWLGLLDVVGCPNYVRVARRRFDTAIVNGPIPRRYRWIIGSPLAATVTFLAYSHEVDVIERQLQGVYGDGAISARSRKRDLALSQGSRSRIARPESHIPSLRLDRPKSPSSKLNKEPKITITDFDMLPDALQAAERARTALEGRVVSSESAQWQEDAGDDEPDESADGLQPHIDDVAAMLIEANSRSLGVGEIFLASDNPIECMRPSRPGEILRITPDALRPGDILLRMDEAGRTGIFERIIELAEGQPQLEYLAAFRRSWRDAMERLARQFRVGDRTDYREMLAALRHAGAGIASELALRLWVNDKVIGPEKVASIVAVGTVTRSEVLVRAAKEYDRAFRKIRSIHQGVGRRLNGAIRRSFTHFAEEVGDLPPAKLDDRLGVPLEELLETIDLAEVLSVAPGCTMVAPGLIGRFTVRD